ncbi:metallophosphoesterase [candidate division KSB1 bacterium]|nr:metallophosphoesterase [candidate division KSB1 bacterium]
MNKKNVKSSVIGLILMSFIFLGINSLFGEITRKAPYLIYNGNNTEMQVIWQLSSTETCSIEWGADILYTMGNEQTSEYGDDHQHTYTITGLTPDTKYYYRITADQEIHTGSFSSAPDTSATAIKFFAYGDTRTYPADHNNVAAGMVDTYTGDEEFQTFILVVGDLINNGDSEVDWDEQLYDPQYLNIKEMFATLPYQSCMGNHEGSGNLFIKYLPYPFVADRYWSFDYGPAHFVVVDQYVSYAPDSPQLIWIENDLAATTKMWKFICLHEPGWSADGGHENNTSVQNYIQPLCEQYGVSVVFAGHNHYYSRAEVNHVTHLTTGGGGAPLRDPDPNYPNIVIAERIHHFCKVEIDSNLLNISAVDINGSIIDSFTVDYYTAYANQINFSHTYLLKGIDTLTIDSRTVNRGGHNIELKAMILSTDSSYQDSVQLVDDGLHDDGAAGDGVYGNSIVAPDVENEFMVDINTLDLNTGLTSVSNATNHFTTRGPVLFEDLEFRSSDTEPNPGDRMRMKPSLKNYSAADTVTDIKSSISSLDTLVYVRTNYQRYGDIAPGEIAISNAYAILDFSEDCPDSTEILFAIEISSNDYKLWADTFSILVVNPSSKVRGAKNVPDKFTLSQNYPNPFNPNTTISFILERTEHTTIQIFNITGQIVENLVDQELDAGSHQIMFNADKLVSGIYFCKIQSGSYADIKKMILMK